MKKIFSFLRKCKKGFTLMECVCAIAVVGLLSAVILPLTASSMKSLRASDALRAVASEAAAENASITTDKTDKTHTESMYVTIAYTTDKLTDMRAESAFVFTKTSASDTDLKVSVTYYDLKYGKETEDIKK